jgi:hypothetical protein
VAQVVECSRGPEFSPQYHTKKKKKSERKKTHTKAHHEISKKKRYKEKMLYVLRQKNRSHIKSELRLASNV